MRKSIDLHLHFDGSLSLKNFKDLAKMQGIAMDLDDDALSKKLSVDDGCRELKEYLTKFDFPLALLQTRSSIRNGMKTLCDELVQEGCVYAEIRFAPQLHMQKGLTQAQVVNAAIEGFKASTLLGGLILCCMRGDDNHSQNVETVDIANKFLGKGVCALDLAGNEGGYPNENFEDIFQKAKILNIPFTLHSGEADGADSVVKAIEMGASRIGHGVRAIEDPYAVKLLVENHIPLEICPTSNLNTAICEDISSHPLKQLMDLGVIVTVNSDNRTVSQTTAVREMSLIESAFSLGEQDVTKLINNSINSAFCDSKTKDELRKMINE